MTQNASSLAGASPSSERVDVPPAVASEAADQPDGDPIAEAPPGRQGVPAAPPRAQDRVDWMAASAQGPRILDIGCGEGILALLLASAGHRVVAVDIEPAAIAAARDLASSQPPAVRDRIDWRVADAQTGALGLNAFDTVVLGDVVAWLEEPARMLARAADGTWSGTSEPSEPGFFYYELLIDGVAVNDPGSETYFGWGRQTSGIEIPERGVDFHHVKGVPHGEVRARTYESKVTGTARRAFVYTPPDYDRDAASAGRCSTCSTGRARASGAGRSRAGRSSSSTT